MSSTYIVSGVIVRIVQFESPNKACPVTPLPLEIGFSTDKEYEVLGIIDGGTAGELYCLLVNNSDWIVGISNRHLRFVRIKV